MGPAGQALSHGSRLGLASSAKNAPAFFWNLSAAPCLSSTSGYSPCSLQKAKFSGFIFINKSSCNKLLLSMLSDIYISPVSALALN